MRSLHIPPNTGCKAFGIRDLSQTGIIYDAEGTGTGAAEQAPQRVKKPFDTLCRLLRREAESAFFTMELY